MAATSEDRQVIVAGHICLDIIPTFEQSVSNIASLIVPGQLVKIGPAILSTGGAVSNVGLALHRLDVSCRLAGKVGDDLLGGAICQFLRQQGEALAQGMIVAPGAASSYTLVISPPGIDRSFLHCPGANDTFGAEDLDDERLAGAHLMHFGYPPIMHRMFSDGGSELAQLFRRVKEAGLTTSLDMTMVDLNSPAGQCDWEALLHRVLPFVDFYLPSIEETLLMLDRSRYKQLIAENGGGIDIAKQIDGEMLQMLSSRLLDMGAGVVVLKLGDQGIYLHSSGDEKRLSRMGAAGPVDTRAWRSRQLIVPCFEVDVVGTTGSGDCTIAGFLAAVVRGMSPEQSMQSAVAVGACNCEAADATSGVRPWSEVRRRIESGWSRLDCSMSLDGWHPDEPRSTWIGPLDASH
jgi:sugar/nucleoside kinase (ribokinase family)